MICVHNNTRDFSRGQSNKQTVRRETISELRWNRPRWNLLEVVYPIAQSHIPFLAGYWVDPNAPSL